MRILISPRVDHMPSVSIALTHPRTSLWSKLPSLDWTRYLLWRISPFLQFLISNCQPYLTDLHHHATIGSLPLKPTELSLIDNHVVINHFINHETYGEFHPLDPPLRLCSFGPSHDTPSCHSSSMTSSSQPLRW
jgi:hypothetical protein